MTSIRILPVSIQDAAELLEIYRPYVEETYVSFEVSVPSLEEFENRIKTISGRYPYLKAVENGKILGYVYASAFKTRAAYQWAVETSIYVRRGEHSRGVGTMLYEALEAVLARQNIYNLNACITYPNPESIPFHQRCGYREVAHFTKCGYKLGSWHDMIWMEKLFPRPEDPAPFIPITEIDLPAILAEFEGGHHEA